MAHGWLCALWFMQPSCEYLHVRGQRHHGHACWFCRPAMQPNVWHRHMARDALHCNERLMLMATCNFQHLKQVGVHQLLHSDVELYRQLRR